MAPRKKTAKKSSNTKSESVIEDPKAEFVDNNIVSRLEEGELHISSSNTNIEVKKLGDRGNFQITKPERDPDGILKANEDIRRQAFFDQFGSVLVFNGWSRIESALRESKDEIGKFNEKIKELNLQYKIRWSNKVKVNHNIYMYFGSYIYELKDGREVYVGKYSHLAWRKMLTNEEFKAVGVIPKMPVETIKFRPVSTRDPDSEEESDYKKYDTIILPYNEYRRNIKYFKKLPTFRLG